MSSRVDHPGAVPVFILCGGLGTRLRSVDCRPKAIIPIAGLPFLTYTLRLLRLQGFRTVHLLLGTGADEVQAAVSGPGIAYSREERPLGTGGALGLARARAGGTNLILNGDSYAEVVYEDLLCEHARHGEQADRAVTLMALAQENCADYGSLDISPDGEVRSFREKGSAGPGWINAGVYAAGRGFFSALPEGEYSLETEILPDLARQGLLRARRARFFFRDIGTPERLALADREFRWIRNRMEREGTAEGRRG